MIRRILDLIAAKFIDYGWLEERQDAEEKSRRSTIRIERRQQRNIPFESDMFPAIHSRRHRRVRG